MNSQPPTSEATAEQLMARNRRMLFEQDLRFILSPEDQHKVPMILALLPESK